MSPRHGIAADPNDRTRKVRPAAMPRGGVAIRSRNFHRVIYPVALLPREAIAQAIKEHWL